MKDFNTRPWKYNKGNLPIIAFPKLARQYFYKISEARDAQKDNNASDNARWRMVYYCSFDFMRR